MSHRSILIVEDHSELRSLLKEAFEMAGWKVDATPSGKVALELIKDNTYTTLLTDLKMPEMDGLEYIKQVNKIPAHPPIVIYSNFPYDYAKKDAFIHGASLFVSKDNTSIDQLIKLVENLSQPTSNSRLS